MAQRQKAHALVLVTLRDQGVKTTHRVNQTLVQVHRTFGLASGAGCVNQNSQVFGLAAVHALLYGLQMLGVVGPAQCAQSVQADDVRVIQAAQTVHIKHHNLTHARELCAHLQRLVELLVIFYKQHAGRRVLAQVMHLAGGIGGVDAIGHATCRQYGQVGPHPFHHRICQNRGGVALLKAKTHQPTGYFAHGIGALAPGPGAPKAQVLLAQPDIGATLLYGVPEHGGNRFPCHHDLGVGLNAA